MLPWRYCTDGGFWSRHDWLSWDRTWAGPLTWDHLPLGVDGEITSPTSHSERNVPLSRHSAPTHVDPLHGNDYQSCCSSSWCPWVLTSYLDLMSWQWACNNCRFLYSSFPPLNLGLMWSTSSRSLLVKYCPQLGHLPFCFFSSFATLVGVSISFPRLVLQ